MMTHEVHEQIDIRPNYKVRLTLPNDFNMEDALMMRAALERIAEENEGRKT